MPGRVFCCGPEKRNSSASSSSSFFQPLTQFIFNGAIPRAGFRPEESLCLFDRGEKTPEGVLTSFGMTSRLVIAYLGNIDERQREPPKAISTRPLAERHG